MPVMVLMAVPVRITPEAGEVTLDNPKAAKSCVPAHNVVVVGVCVKVCAFAPKGANAKRERTASPVEIAVLPDVLCGCVYFERFIEFLFL